MSKTKSHPKPFVCHPSNILPGSWGASCFAHATTKSILHCRDDSKVIPPAHTAEPHPQLGRKKGAKRTVT